MKILLNYLILLLIKSSLSVVLELNDKFLDVYKKDHTRSWIVKFYAPWCHHCRQIGRFYLLR